MEMLTDRVVKPWLQPNIVFSMWNYVNGYQKIFDTVLEYPKMVMHDCIHVPENIESSAEKGYSWC